MAKELFLLAEKLKRLREQCGMTQAELARRMGLTRSSVNAWEMGLSVPSTAMIVELSRIFRVSSDYLLGLPQNSMLDISGLSEKQVAVLTELVRCLRDGPAGSAEP